MFLLRFRNVKEVSMVGVEWVGEIGRRWGLNFSLYVMKDLWC